MFIPRAPPLTQHKRYQTVLICKKNALNWAERAFYSKKIAEFTTAEVWTQAVLSKTCNSTPRQLRSMSGVLLAVAQKNKECSKWTSGWCCVCTGSADLVPSWRRNVAAKADVWLLFRMYIAILCCPLLLCFLKLRCCMARFEGAANADGFWGCPKLGILHTVPFKNTLCTATLLTHMLFFIVVAAKLGLLWILRSAVSRCQDWKFHSTAVGYNFTG